MTKTFNFYSKNSSNNNTFHGIKSTNYSKIIDNIILGDIIKKNDYLFDDDDYTYTPSSTTTILTSSYLKGGDKFTKAAKFLANYKKNKKLYKIPYEFGKMYTLSDGTRIVFYDDEIQIGSLFYKYDDFNDYDFLNTISEPTKKIIINITINIL